MDTGLLEQLGLTKGEIKAYLAMLKLGSTSTGPLAKESGVSRSKLYSILDRLEKRGLASHVEERGVIQFQAAEPAKIKDYIKAREEELNGLETEFDKFLPTLEKWKKGVEKVQKVAFYQGLKGTETAYDHLYAEMKRGEEYYGIGIPAYQSEEFHRFWQKDHLRRVKAGIKCKLLFNSETPREVLENRNSYWGCDARYMPPGAETFAWIGIYKTFVIINIPAENSVTVEIVNKEIRDTFKAQFDEVWARTKPFKKH